MIREGVCEFRKVMGENSRGWTDCGGVRKQDKEKQSFHIFIFFLYLVTPFSLHKKSRERERV